MGKKTKEEWELFLKNLQYVERFFYDVLVYTLPKCGLPENSLPTTDCEENSYNLPNYVESVGLLVLTSSLARKDTFKQVFASRHKSYGFHDEGMQLYITKLIWSYKNKHPVTNFFIMKISLVISNEIMLFFHHNRIDIDFNKLIKSVGKIIVGATRPDEDVLKTAKELYVKFDDLSVYNMWITYFITKYAIPYGYRNDVAEFFNKYFEMLWTLQFTKNDCLDIQIKRKMGSWKRISVNALTAAIKSYEALSEILALGLIVEPNDSESPNSENGKNDLEASSKIRPLGIVVPCVGESCDSENTKNNPEASSKILKLGIVVPCVSETPNSENAKYGLEALSKILPLGQFVAPPCDSKSTGFESFKNDSETSSKISQLRLVVPCDSEFNGSENSKNDLLVGKQLYKKDSTTPSNVSDQSEQSSKQSSELGIEDDMKQIHLDAKGACKKNRDVTAKRKRHKQKRTGKRS